VKSLKAIKIQRVHTYIMTEHKQLPHNIIWTFTLQCNIPCWNANKQLAYIRQYKHWEQWNFSISWQTQYLPS